MVQLKLKTKKDIKATLTNEEDDGVSVAHCNGVLHKQEVMDTLNGMDKLEIKDFYLYGENYAIGIVKPDGVTTYISPDWVKEVTGSSITVENLKTETNGKVTGYVYISDTYVVEVETMTIIAITSLNVCTCCGSVIENVPQLKAIALCGNCLSDKYYTRHNYSHKPEPKFTGSQLDADTENNVWFGIELEYGIHDKIGVSLLAKDHNIYLKSDSSIEGGDAGKVEMVTHPYSFSELMKKGSWVNDLSHINANESTSNGCHVHVSRTAWQDDKHYALMYFLMYEMGKEGILEHIGGREFTNYCRFDAPAQLIHKKKKDSTNGDRTVWCNETNSPTIEFRFFGGTNDPKVLKRYVQLLESLIKYTKYHAKTVSFDGWFKYIHKYGKKYAELVEFLTGFEYDNKNVTFRLPTQKQMMFNKMPFGAVQRIISIKQKKGDDIVGIERVVIENTCMYIYFEDKKKSGMSIAYHDIQEVVIEE